MILYTIYPESYSLIEPAKVDPLQWAINLKMINLRFRSFSRSKRRALLQELMRQEIYVMTYRTAHICPHSLTKRQADCSIQHIEQKVIRNGVMRFEATSNLALLGFSYPKYLLLMNDQPKISPDKLHWWPQCRQQRLNHAYHPLLSLSPARNAFLQIIVS